MKTPIVFVEHDTKLLTRLRAVFSGHFRFDVRPSFTTINSAIRGIPKLKPTPQVVLMDIEFSTGSGVEATRALKSMMPDLLVIMLTVIEDSATLFEALKAGADGYLLKDTPIVNVVTAVEEAIAGGSPMTAGIARKVLKHFTIPKPTQSLIEALTITERRLLEYKIQHGGSSKELGEAFNVAASTIESHFKRILKKLKADDRTDAVAVYFGARRKK